MELRESVCHILRFSLAMCNEEILQIATASLFQVLLAVFLPNII